MTNLWNTNKVITPVTEYLLVYVKWLNLLN